MLAVKPSRALVIHGGGPQFKSPARYSFSASIKEKELNCKIYIVPANGVNQQRIANNYGEEIKSIAQNKEYALTQNSSAQTSMEMDPSIGVCSCWFKPKRWLIHTIGGSLIDLSGFQGGKRGNR